MSSPICPLSRFHVTCAHAGASTVESEVIAAWMKGVGSTSLSVGVAELLAALEATCRDTHALPFMGEPVPEARLQVTDAL